MKRSEMRAKYVKRQEKLQRQSERAYQKKEELAAKTKCTMCGKQFSIFDVQDGWLFDDHRGYGSKYDEIHIKFNLCADCLDKIIDYVRENSINPVFMKEYDSWAGQFYHVFLGGSQSVNELPEKAIEQLSKYNIATNMDYLVGDCKGADTLFQQYLKDNDFRRVRVYVSGDEVRNNVGDYEVFHVKTGNKEDDRFEYYKKKDYAMAEIADSALMVWDGKSKGTFLNIVDMTAMHKPTEVFIIGNPKRIIIEKTEYIISMLDEIKADKVLYELLDSF